MSDNSRGHVRTECHWPGRGGRHTRQRALGLGGAREPILPNHPSALTVWPWVELDCASRVVLGSWVKPNTDCEPESITESEVCLHSTAPALVLSRTTESSPLPPPPPPPPPHTHTHTHTLTHSLLSSSLLVPVHQNVSSSSESDCAS
jgi:hypothetical protein